MDVNFEHKAISLSKNEHEQEEYLKICPIGAVPMLCDKNYKILGNLNNFVSYICDQTLYTPDCDAHLTWY